MNSLDLTPRVGWVACIVKRHVLIRVEVATYKFALKATMTNEQLLLPIYKATCALVFVAASLLGSFVINLNFAPIK